MNTVQDMTLQQVEETFSVLAKKFSLLLAASDLPDDMQDALIGALPHMSIEQIVHLTNVLEAKYSVSKTREQGAGLVHKIENIAQSFAGRQKARDESLVQDLHTLTTRLATSQ